MDEEAKECSLVEKIGFLTILCFIISCIIYLAVMSIMDSDRRPSLSIQDLHVPALKNPNPSLFNATPLHPSILVDIKFKDTFFTKLRTTYADLQMTVFYGVDRSFPVANYTLPGFPMNDRPTVHKGVAIDAPGLPWEDAIRKVSGGLPVDLVVGMAVKYADYQCCCCRSPVVNCDWPEGMVWADVAVDASGEKVSKKPIAFAYDRFNL